MWWAPRRASWWIGLLFAIGASCFLVASLPGVEPRIGSGADAWTFVVGSVFFTTAAGLQWLETINADPGPGIPHARFHLVSLEPHRIDWWASGVQLVGTTLFNLNTVQALRTGSGGGAYDRLVWAPEALGSVCFLASGLLSYGEVGGRPARPRWASLEWDIAAVGLAGCMAFALSAVAAFGAPSSAAAMHPAAANALTALGAVCFLAGAVLLLPEGARVDPGPGGLAPDAPTPGGTLWG